MSRLGSAERYGAYQRMTRTRCAARGALASPLHEPIPAIEWLVDPIYQEQIRSVTSPFQGGQFDTPPAVSKVWSPGTFQAPTPSLTPRRPAEQGGAAGLEHHHMLPAVRAGQVDTIRGAYRS